MCLPRSLLDSLLSTSFGTAYTSALKALSSISTGRLSPALVRQVFLQDQGRHDRQFHAVLQLAEDRFLHRQFDRISW